MTQNYIGEIRPFGGTFAPYGWHLCDGSLLDIATYSTLFNLIGTTYGGNGQTTFALPDLRGRNVIHQGQGAGLSQYVMGQQVGVENVTVTTAQMAGHPHTFAGNSGAGTAPNPGTTVLPSAAGAGNLIYDGAGGVVSLSPRAVSSSGGSVPHNNRQPYVAITYIIALEGVYPPQS
jgi:microcystin-dependent protein